MLIHKLTLVGIIIYTILNAHRGGNSKQVTRKLFTKPVKKGVPLEILYNIIDPLPIIFGEKKHSIPSLPGLSCQPICNHGISFYWRNLYWKEGVNHLKNVPESFSSLSLPSWKGPNIFNHLRGENKSLLTTFFSNFHFEKEKTNHEMKIETTSRLKKINN